MPGARWPKVHLLCQVAKGWWLQQNQSLKGMFYNELFFNCEKSPKPWALSSPFDVGVYYEFAKIDIWHQCCNSASSGKAIKDRVKKTPSEIGLVSKSSTTRLPSNSAGNAWAPLAWFSLHYAASKCARAGSGSFLCTTCSVCILGLLLKTCPLTTSPLATQLLDVNSLEWPEKNQGGRLSCEVKWPPSPHPHYSYFIFVLLYSSFFFVISLCVYMARENNAPMEKIQYCTVSPHIETVHCVLLWNFFFLLFCTFVFFVFVFSLCRAKENLCWLVVLYSVVALWPSPKISTLGSLLFPGP